MRDVGGPYLFALRVGVRVAVALLVMEGLDQGLSRAPVSILMAVPDMPAAVQELHDATGTILYLGDSIVQRRTRDDPQRRTLAARVATDLGEPVSAVTHAARGPDTFLEQIRWLGRRGLRPRLVIVPINMRAFGPQWEFNPAWNFGLGNGMYRHPIRTRMLAVFKYDFGALAPDDLRRRRVRYGAEDLGSLADAVAKSSAAAPGAAEMRRRYLVRYGTAVEDSRRFAAVRALLAELGAAPYPSIVYVSPVDLEKMATVLGAEAQARVRANVEKIWRLMRAADVTALNLAETLPARDFDQPPGLPGGHLLARGVTETAARIAAAAAPLLDPEPADLEIAP
jgi:hypothetical protein